MNTDREDKPAWAAVPAGVKRRVTEVLGANVDRAVRAYGGYGPSATFVLHLENGSRAFFKGTYPLPPQSGVRWALAGEEKVYRQLGNLISPWAPAYFGSVRTGGWHAILIEAVDGQAPLPWTSEKAKRAARSFAEFHASTVGRQLPTWLPRRQHHGFSTYWTRLTRDATRVAALASLAGDAAPGAHAWLDKNLARLAATEALLRRRASRSALLHFDTRSDNIRLQRDRLRIFDWPFACSGPPEFDLAAFAQSIESEAGPPGEDVMAWYAEVLPVEDERLAAAMVGLSGYFADRAPLPEMPELPRLRSVQRRQLKASLALSARMLSLTPPTWLDSVPR